ncbi:MAG: hypothetical protein JWM74_3227, partial [Myxococcaceae bacterium]|nr:hypothetical protein [Myxococcaceae bacterium]
MARSLRSLKPWLLMASAASCQGAAPQVASVVVVAPPAPAASSTQASAAPPTPAPVALEDVEGPPPPAKRPIDPAIKVDGGGLLLGVTSTEIGYLIGGHYTVVIDRATGCAVEGYPDPEVLSTLRKASDPDAELARPEILAALRDVVGLGRRLGAQGQRFLLDMVWSLDGRYVFLEIDDHLYRSSNGARSFARVD